MKKGINLEEIRNQGIFWTFWNNNPDVPYWSPGLNTQQILSRVLSKKLFSRLEARKSDRLEFLHSFICGLEIYCFYWCRKPFSGKVWSFHTWQVSLIKQVQVNEWIEFLFCFILFRALIRPKQRSGSFLLKTTWIIYTTLE